MFNKIITTTIIAVLLIVAYRILKSLFLYHPILSNPAKYQKFYAKLSALVESKDLIENNTIQTQDDFLLDTVYIRNPHTDRCIIFFHGNAGNLSMRYDMIKFLYNFGSVVIFDYRSYGYSSGDVTDLTCNGLCADGYAIWKYVTTILKYKSDMVTLFGESLGCSIVLKLAADLSKTFDSDNYPHSLILNSPFSSLTSMINNTFNKYNFTALQLLFSFIESDYDSMEWIKYVNHTTKIIIAHSPTDEIIPYSDAQKLFNNIAHPNAKFINIYGGHNDLGLTNNYVYSVSEMLQE